MPKETSSGICPTRRTLPGFSWPKKSLGSAHEAFRAIIPVSSFFGFRTFQLWSLGVRVCVAEGHGLGQRWGMGSWVEWVTSNIFQFFLKCLPSLNGHRSEPASWLHWLQDWLLLTSSGQPDWGWGGGRWERNWAGINPVRCELTDKGGGDQVTFFPSLCLGRWRRAKEWHYCMHGVLCSCSTLHQCLSSMAFHFMPLYSMSLGRKSESFQKYYQWPRDTERSKINSPFDTRIVDAGHCIV
jgi:hypothetical protein